MEVTLTGLAPNTGGSGFGRYPSVTPINLLGRHVPGEMEYGVDYMNVPEEFRYCFEDSILSLFSQIVVRKIPGNAFRR